jgi:competence protein ComEC
MKWLPYPMVRIAGFFTGGVLLSIYFPDLLSLRFAIILISLCFLSFLILKFYSKQNKFPTSLGFLGLSAIFLFGFVRLILFTDARDESHLSKLSEPVRMYEGIVRSVPEEKAKSWKIEIEIISVKTNAWKPVTGNLLLYVSKKNNSLSNWHYGDKILVKGAPQELRPPGNPGEFDFKRFLSFKNISHQQFVQSNDVKFLAPTSRKGFIYYSHQARAWSMRKLKEYVHGEDERAIAIALVLGVTDGIDNDLQNAYAASGAMHVLAVSGMHVGIIYAIILFLFKPLNKYRWSKWMTAIISLLLLWAFAFVTGLSPSVLRAVYMFSFIALARPFGKQTNIYNTLAASAFLLLIYNPYLIMSVGFQLSYLAVLGIVYLQRPLYNLWEIENWVGDWIWKITCVSMAAQAATFALGLLYFHQFPTYFLISNLFVIPLSTLVLLMGIFLLTVSMISPIASLTAIILEWLIKSLNWIVFKTEALPSSLINNIHITIFQCWLLMGILIALILLFEFKSIQWLYTSVGLTIVFAIAQWSHFFSSVDHQRMVVYSINNHQAFEFIDRGRSYFACDSLLENDAERVRFHIQPNRLTHGVSKTNLSIPFSTTRDGIRYMRWRGKTIAWVKDRNSKLPLNSSVDGLIISNNSLSKKEIEKIKASQIIFDGSNSRKIVSYLATIATKRKIKIHTVANEGAFMF